MVLNKMLPNDFKLSEALDNSHGFHHPEDGPPEVIPRGHQRSPKPAGDP